VICWVCGFHVWPIKTRGVDWCPLLTQAIQAMQHWKGWAKRWASGTISKNVLQTWAWKVHIKHEVHGPGPMATLIQQRLDAAYTTFKRIKVQHDCRATWIGELIVAQAEAQGCRQTQLWKKVWATEKIWKVMRMVKCTLQLNELRRGLTQVMEPGNGQQVAVTHTTKHQVEQACLLFNDLSRPNVAHPAFKGNLVQSWPGHICNFWLWPGCPFPHSEWHPAPKPLPAWHPGICAHA